MSNSPPQSAAGNLVYVLLTAVLGVMIGVFLLLGGLTVADSLSGNGQAVDATQTVPGDQLDDLPNFKADGGCDQPECVVIEERVPVKIMILNGNGLQIFLDRSRSFLTFVLVLTTVWILRSLVNSVRKDEPFVETNVKRLRMLGLVLLLGWPLVEVANNFLTGALADTTNTGSLGPSAWNIPPARGAVLAGLIVLILAQVFAHGLRLREDVEGTV